MIIKFHFTVESEGGASEGTMGVGCSNLGRCVFIFRGVRRRVGLLNARLSSRKEPNAENEHEWTKINPMVECDCSERNTLLAHHAVNRLRDRSVNLPLRLFRKRGRPASVQLGFDAGQGQLRENSETKINGNDKIADFSGTAEGPEAHHRPKRKGERLQPIKCLKDVVHCAPNMK